MNHAARGGPAPAARLHLRRRPSEAPTSALAQGNVPITADEARGTIAFASRVLVAPAIVSVIGRLGAGAVLADDEYARPLPETHPGSMVLAPGECSAASDCSGCDRESLAEAPLSGPTRTRKILSHSPSIRSCSTTGHDLEAGEDMPPSRCCLTVVDSALKARRRARCATHVSLPGSPSERARP
jgi:hypothetical protein